MTDLTFLIINFLTFHTSWLGNAFGAAHNITWLGPILVIPSIFIHFYIVEDRPRELLNIITISLFGYLIDSIHMKINALEFLDGQLFFGLPPVWLFFQWLIFSTLFSISLYWLKGRYLMGAILGATGGPFSYLAAVQLNAFTIPSSTMYSLSILAVSWTLMMPVFIWITHFGRERSRFIGDYLQETEATQKRTKLN